MMTDTSLELRHVRKSFGDLVAVDGLSLAVPPGTIFGLLGPNGAGKTTTIRMVMDIIAPDEGEIHFWGRPRREGDLRRVGYLPEERGLYPKMKVLEQLVFLGELRGLAKAEARRRGAEWLERLGLADRAEKKTEELSKGMQQKIQIAGTLLHEPDIVILDEPFSGLDPINQTLFKELLADYRREGRTIVFSTHVMEQAEKLCDAICLVSDGRDVLSGPLAEIKRRFGGHSYRLVADGELDRIEQVPGVEQAIEQDGFVKVMLEPGAQGGEVLRRLVSFLDVREFRSAAPDLEEIFIKAVREAADAA